MTINQSNDDEFYNIPGVREVHAAKNRENCYQMLERFKREGRAIRLTKINSVGKGDLPFRCIFEGPDAEANYWEDRRYEKPESSQGD